jgi:hypothetical protein
MRHVIFAGVAALALGFATAASADEQSAPASAPVAAATQTASAQTVDMNEIVCKQFKVTGQLLPGPKVCRTRWEWGEVQRQAQAQTEKLQDNLGTHGAK